MFRLLALAATSGALLYASYFPLDLGELAWVALVPFCLMICTDARPWKLFLAAWLAGLVFFVPALQWIRVAHPMMFTAWVGLAFYCSILLPLILFLTRSLLRRGIPLAFALPSVWVGIEWVRGTALGGFAWYFLGHSQHHVLPLIQVADLGGAYAVSFVLAAVNAVIAVGLMHLQGVRTFLRLPDEAPGTLPRLSAFAVAALVLAVIGYGFVRLQHEPFDDGPRVALLQGNIEQGVRISRNANDPDEAKNAVTTMLRHHEELAIQAAVEHQPDLIIWPETSFPFPWIILPDEKPENVEEAKWSARTSSLEAIRDKHIVPMGQNWRSYVLLGLNTREITPDGEDRRYNTALLVTPAGEIPSLYHKIHCVPFGEYVPFKETMPWLQRFTPYDHDYSLEPGTDYTRFRIQGDERDYRFGVLICYEDSDPVLARRYVPWESSEGGEPVDFLVNISNDGWFKGTEEHEGHLAICRFRAIEARRAIARSVNMGISAVIDSDGRVIALPGPTWRESKKVSAVVSAVIPVDNRTSFYALAGDWLPALCGLVVLGGLLIAPRREPRDES